MLKVAEILLRALSLSQYDWQSLMINVTLLLLIFQLLSSNIWNTVTSFGYWCSFIMNNLNQYMYPEERYHSSTFYCCEMKARSLYYTKGLSFEWLRACKKGRGGLPNQINIYYIKKQKILRLVVIEHVNQSMQLHWWRCCGWSSWAYVLSTQWERIIIHLPEKVV